MNCARWQPLVALYVGDDLDRSRATRVERHLAECPSCRNLEHVLRRDLRVFRDLGSAAKNGLELGSVRSAVMAEVENRQKRSPVFPQPRLLSALALVVVVVALALVLRPSTEPDAPRTVSREIPGPAPVAMAEPEPSAPSPPQPQPSVAFEASKAPDGRVARVEPSSRGPVAQPTPSAPVEPMTIKILTDDPEVIIYWIVDPKGDNKNV